MAGVLNDYIAGAIGGASGLVVGHPFDTIKVQLQTQQATSPYRNTWEAVKSVNHEGLARGFFRGMGFPLVSYGIVNSVFFGVYGNTLQYLSGVGSNREHASLLHVFLAGCAGGTVQLAVACPVDVVKVVLQSQIPKAAASSVGVHGVSSAQRRHYFQGPVQCVKELYRSRGLVGCYKGLRIQGMRDIPASAAYFVIYESLFKRLEKSPYSDKHGILASLLAGGTAGVASWFIIMPLDVLKSQIQADFEGRKYRGIVDCAIQTYRRKGMKGFFTGVGVNSVRAFNVNAMTFLVYTRVAKYLCYLEAQKDPSTQMDVHVT